MNQNANLGAQLIEVIRGEAWPTWTDEQRLLVVKLYNDGYRNVRILPDGRVIGVLRFMFTHGLCYGLDDTGMSGRYCYDSFAEAMTACREWDGVGHPPLGWIKHKGLGVDERNEQERRDEDV